jgi:hypothetical protein
MIMYVCLYVCAYGWMDGWMDVCMCVCVYMYVCCMYVCVCVFIYLIVCRPPDACLIDHMGCASQSQLMYDHILTSCLLMNDNTG